MNNAEIPAMAPAPPQAAVIMDNAAAFAPIMENAAAGAAPMKIRADMRFDDGLPLYYHRPDYQNNWIAKRIYSHIPRPSKPANIRDEFIDTVYWNSACKVNNDGQAKIRFHLSDHISRYRLMIDGHALTENNGKKIAVFGSNEESFLEAKEPFFIETKLPNELSTGDRVYLPLAIINSSPQNLDIKVTISSTTADNQTSPLRFPRYSPNETPLTVLSNNRLRKIIQMDIDKTSPVEAQLSINANAFLSSPDSSPPPSSPLFTDSFTRSFDVYPVGFPVSQYQSGFIDAKGKSQWNFDLPSNIVPSSINFTARLYPSPTANLMQAIQTLIREPFGCFEQTSSTTYPLVMAAQYFKHLPEGVVDSALQKRVNDLLETGYKKLIGFETSTKGFEWFGRSPGHEGLSAYGLAQFIEMKKVYPVDDSLIDRTKKWLFEQRTDDYRGFKRDHRALDSFGRAPIYTTDAYIIWSLTYSGITDGLEKAIDALVVESDTNHDTYFIALLSGILYNVNRKEESQQLASIITKSQQEDGSVIDARTSITNSMGDSLLIETTSISILAWMNHEDSTSSYTANIENAIQWLVSRCKDGKFGSTQGTVLALKAIINYDRKRKSTIGETDLKEGIVTLFMDGKQMGNPLSFDPSIQTVLSFPSLSSSDFSSSDNSAHIAELRVSGAGFRMPYSFAIDYHATQPASTNNPSVTMDLSLGRGGSNNDNNEYKEGDGVQLSVTIKNQRSDNIAMTVAIIGLPAGFELIHSKLQEQVKAGIFDFYEQRGRELILYWRGLAEKENRSFFISLNAAIPGDYTGAASRIYLYYHDEEKYWIAPIRASIIPAQ